MATRGGGEKRGNWMKVVKRHKFPVTRYISTRDVMYNMIKIINTLYMKVKRVNPKSAHHKEKIFFFYFLSI